MSKSNRGMDRCFHSQVGDLSAIPEAAFPRGLRCLVTALCLALLPLAGQGVRAQALQAAGAQAPFRAGAKPDASVHAPTPLPVHDVSGRVTSAEDGSPLPGVNVVLRGTSTGTVTDTDGRYELTAPAPTDTLVFSFVGYLRQEVPIAGRSVVDVELSIDDVSLDEVVVIGYGARTKQTLSGAVSSVSGEDLEVAPVTNTSNTLVGRVPGLVAMNASGEPGNDGSVIRIRGNHTLGDNNPLIVVDGVPDRAGGLERINPNDIESISVLKDASAAIYGARAANGVILVTTKRGRTGPPRLSVEMNQGFNQPTRVPEMTDAATYLTMLNEISMYAGREPAYSEETIQKYREGADPWLYPNTDWFSETLKPLSAQTMGNVSVTGGSEDVTYYLSLRGLTEDGYYQNSATRFNQINFRSNFDAQINNSIRLRFDVGGRVEDRNYPTRSVGEIFRMVMRGKPHLPAVWPNGLPGPDIEYGDNPAVITTDATGYNQDQRNYLQTRLELNVDVPGIEGLSFRANGAFDRSFRENKNWQTPWTLYTWDGETYDQNGVPVVQGSQRGYSEPRLFQEYDRSQNILANLVGSYEWAGRDHAFSVLAGTEAQTFRNNFFNAFRRNYITDRIDQLFAGGEAGQNNSGRASQGARLNYFSRFNYDYQQKYLLEAVARLDGSYLFPEDKRYGFFPAVSAAWRLSQEPFFRNGLPFFDEFKLRASMGRTGNDRIDPWQYLGTYGYSQGYVFGDQIAPGVFQTRTPNPGVGWEIANQFDVGLEATMMDHRLGVELDYFRYKRTDILWWRNESVPWTAGFSLPRENIGEVSSWGYDGMATYRAQLSDDAFMDIGLIATYTRNKIDFWDEAPGAPDYQRSTGAPMNTGLYYKAIGIFQSEDEIAGTPHWSGAQPGDVIFEDVNGDGEINGLDRVRIDKNNAPRFTGGVNLRAVYGDVDLSLLFQGAAGAVQYVFTESGEIGNFLQEFADNRWTPDNPSTTHPRTFNRNNEYWTNQPNTFWLRPTDYIRLKNLQIGYTLPPSLSRRVGLDRLRVYASGFNLLTLDRLKLLDPEATTQDGQYYPQKRVYNVGLSATL